ncbi:MAG: redox-sensing transcriptional repressor Rex [Chitinivibrionia bacterium]|nr:redox-sensing transcriptional repressor Rex [Chitinivibrionia bacterium]
MDDRAPIPIPVIRRLSHYLQHVRVQIELGREWISSLELAEALEVTSSTVRQDLSWLDISGTAKRGYKTVDLEASILQLIGKDRASNIVIVGAGNLGRALSQHEEFSRQGFVIIGLFDSSNRVIGKKVGKLVVQSVDDLPQVVQEKNIEIGVISVPAKAAQAVADQLVSAGVQGLLNMSCAHVRAPNGVSVVEARMFSSLSLLSYAIKARKAHGSEKGR